MPKNKFLMDNSTHTTNALGRALALKTDFKTCGMGNDSPTGENARHMSYAL
jgi:hypothetical protein